MIEDTRVTWTETISKSLQNPPQTPHNLIQFVIQKDSLTNSYIMGKRILRDFK